jgi:hypothetical protein
MIAPIARLVSLPGTAHLFRQNGSPERDWSTGEIPLGPSTRTDFGKRSNGCTGRRIRAWESREDESVELIYQTYKTYVMAGRPRAIAPVSQATLREPTSAE